MLRPLSGCAEPLTEFCGQSIEQGAVHVPTPRRLDDVRECPRTLLRFQLADYRHDAVPELCPSESNVFP